MPATPYQERYCAFADILGFRGLIADLENKPEGVDALRRILTAIHRPFSTGGELFGDDDLAQDFRSQSISDARPFTIAPRMK